MSIKEIQDEIIGDFEFLETREDRYNHIIEFGKSLAPLSENLKIEENLIKACQSKVWLVASEKDGNIYFEADSEAFIVKGIVALLVRVLSGHSAQQILEADLYFLEKIGLNQLLSMNRSNGLASMLKQMKYYALAYSAK